MDSPSAAILVLLFVFLTPVLASIFGSPLFITATLLCCFLSVCLILAGQPILAAGPWFGAWVFAVIGIDNKREHRQLAAGERHIAQMKRAIGKLYAAASNDRVRLEMRGKNRAIR
jgi:hypothetical protein